jgi:hypothetical protein
MTKAVDSELARSESTEALAKLYRHARQRLLANEPMRAEPGAPAFNASALSVGEARALHAVGLSSAPWKGGVDQDPLMLSITDYMALLETSYTTKEVARLLKVDASRVRQRLRERSLLGIDYAGEKRLPRFQFEGRMVLPGLRDILAVLPEELTPLDVAEWFLSDNPDLEPGDEAPFMPARVADTGPAGKRSRGSGARNLRMLSDLNRVPDRRGEKQAPSCARSYLARCSWALLLSVMVLSTTACVPWFSKYYAAHGPGEVSAPAACSTRYFQDLEVKLDGGAVFTISAVVSLKDPSAVRLSVQIRMPPLQQARLERPTILIQENSDGEKQAIPIGSLTVWSRTAAFRDNTVQSADAIMYGESALDNHQFRDFTVQVDLPYKNPSSFTVEFPALVFPDHVVHVPVITFTLEHTVHVVGAMCV